MKTLTPLKELNPFNKTTCTLSDGTFERETASACFYQLNNALFA